MKKDPELKAIFDDQPKFNQFAKKIKKNIRRMFQRRGYDDSEIGNLLERMHVEREIKNSVKKILLEGRR
jgi:adenylyl- and sulfurtransferase ThiI